MLYFKSSLTNKDRLKFWVIQVEKDDAMRSKAMY